MAIYTPTLISNLALAHLGDTSIRSFDENSEAARVCRSFYPHALQRAFESHGWRIFKRTFQLQPLPNAPSNLLRWKYAYSYPPNCARVEAYGQTVDMEPEYQDFDETADWIAANASPLYCEFISTDFSEASFKGYFVDVVAHLLAIYAAPKLQGSLASADDLEESFTKKTLPQARAQDSQGIATRRTTQSIWSARRFGGRHYRP